MIIRFLLLLVILGSLTGCSVIDDGQEQQLSRQSEKIPRGNSGEDEFIRKVVFDREIQTRSLSQKPVKVASEYPKELPLPDSVSSGDYMREKQREMYGNLMADGEMPRNEDATGYGDPAEQMIAYQEDEKTYKTAFGVKWSPEEGYIESVEFMLEESVLVEDYIKALDVKGPMNDSYTDMHGINGHGKEGYLEKGMSGHENDSYLEKTDSYWHGVEGYVEKYGYFVNRKKGYLEIIDDDLV